MTSPPAQDWIPGEYARNARFVAELGRPLIDLLAPRPGERILDLGCGDGALTLELEKLGCEVVGVDASPEMVKAARTLGIDARVADGQALAFTAEFDAVFSNAALHWMLHPDAVVAGVRRALRPGGRFAGEMAGHGNTTAIVVAVHEALGRRGLAAPSFWYFPRPEEYRAVLERHGFAVEHATLFPRPTQLPGDVGAWIETFGKAWLAAVPETDRAAFLAGIVERLRPTLCDEQGRWTADYVRLRFLARLPNT
jgi:trans-aconitate methyltransferase